MRRSNKVTVKRILTEAPATVPDDFGVFGVSKKVPRLLTNKQIRTIPLIKSCKIQVQTEGSESTETVQVRHG